MANIGVVGLISGVILRVIRIKSSQQALVKDIMYTEEDMYASLERADFTIRCKLSKQELYKITAIDLEVMDLTHNAPIIQGLVDKLYLRSEKGSLTLNSTRGVLECLTYSKLGRKLANLEQEIDGKQLVEIYERFHELSKKRETKVALCIKYKE